MQTQNILLTPIQLHTCITVDRKTKLIATVSLRSDLLLCFIVLQDCTRTENKPLNLILTTNVKQNVIDCIPPLFHQYLEVVCKLYGSIMLWGCFCATSLGRFVKDKMNTSKYREILMEKLPPSSCYRPTSSINSKLKLPQATLQSIGLKGMNTCAITYFCVIVVCNFDPLVEIRFHFGI